MEIKTRKNLIIKVVLSTVGLALLALVLIFTAMMVYYLWQFKFGDPEKLARLDNTYSNKFTHINSEAPKSDIKITDVKKIIRAENPQNGPQDAPVTIVAFIDFECPYSQEDYPNIKNILDTYGPTVRLVVKHLPFTNMHPNAQKVALASICADEQDKFWEYYNKMYERQSVAISDEYITSQAKALGLNMTSFANCLDSEKYKKMVDQDMLDAIEMGVQGTPTYIVGSSIIEGVVDRDTWDATIIQNLK